jgi:hypothetical protein
MKFLKQCSLIYSSKDGFLWINLENNVHRGLLELTCKILYLLPISENHDMFAFIFRYLWSAPIKYKIIVSHL